MFHPLDSPALGIRTIHLHPPTSASVVMCPRLAFDTNWDIADLPGNDMGGLCTVHWGH